VWGDRTQTGHTDAITACAPVERAHERLTEDRAVSRLKSVLAASAAGSGLTRDPFLESPDLASAASRPADRRAGGAAVAATSPRRTVPNGTQPRAADGLGYLDRQLERLDAAMREAAGEDVRAVAWLDGEDLQVAQGPEQADPRAMFDQLARRESSLPGIAPVHPGPSLTMDALPPPFAEARSGMEELQPSPDAHASHLARIVDSNLVPRRGYEQPGDPGPREAMPRIQPDFLGVEAAVSEAPPGAPSTAMVGPEVPHVAGDFLEQSPFEPPLSRHSSGARGFEDEPETLPALDVAMNVDAPAPSAPLVGNAWSPPPNRAAFSPSRASRETPRTLAAIDFSKQSPAAPAPALARFRGPLIVVFGLLLVLFAGAAIRRQAAARR
jgi:hypothetical protein